MTHYFGQNLFAIKVIPIPLMTKLVSNPNLFVMKTEINVYIMLVQWMYLMIHQDASENITLQDINNFFIARTGNIKQLLNQFLGKLMSFFFFR